jgi:hypothetical protein
VVNSRGDIYKLKKLAVFFALIVSFSIVPSQVAFAAADGCTTKFGIPTWYRYLPTTSKCEVIDKDLNGKTVFPFIILGATDIALWLAGLLAVFMILWGGYKFILSDGNPDQIAGARKTILNAVIGLVIAIFAAQVVKFIASRLSS